ncbi:hypothetical protein FRC02_005241 [Tulasnella sp. 418]|nr:hypothetical protein FRC02_005241 [Tulasnella sp. 418]
MTLSSYLAECTGQAKFKDVAILSANCIKRWMIDPATKLIKECFIDVLKVKEREGAVLSCHLTGMAIEGFHVLAVVSGDESWKSLANDIAVAAMRHNEWHTPDGILNVGSNEDVSKSTDNNMFKGWLNRGLLVAYQHNRTNEPFCNLIRGYINVQFNALYELSRYCSSYGCQWSGPYVGPYAHAQATAIDTLVAAVGVNDI